MTIIQRYKDKGRLERFRIPHAQIAKHVSAAYQDLDEAKKTFPVSAAAKSIADTAGIDCLAKTAKSRSPWSIFFASRVRLLVI